MIMCAFACRRKRTCAVPERFANESSNSPAH